MALVVHKYGGSSVADAEKIKNVARRIANVREKGIDVVAVVSAMGNSTDQLIDLAHSVSFNPHARELDLLLSTGELVSSTLLTMPFSLTFAIRRATFFIFSASATDDPPYL